MYYHWQEHALKIDVVKELRQVYTQATHTRNKDYRRQIMRPW